MHREMHLLSYNELEATDVAAEKGAHYYGYLCNFATSQWYKLDDNDVDNVAENEVLADARDKVCMLHYVCFGSEEYELCHKMDTSYPPCSLLPSTIHLFWQMPLVKKQS